MAALPGEAIEPAEGGVFFSAGGWLYLMSGAGFHQLAREPLEGVFSRLFFHHFLLLGKSGIRQQ